MPSCRWPSKRWPNCLSPPNCTSKYATPLGTKEASLLAVPPKVAAALEPQLRTDLARRMLWTLTHFGAYVVDGGAGSFNMAFEAGPNVSMSPEVQGTAAAQLAVAHNLSDPFGYKQNVAFTALRVSESQRAGSVCFQCGNVLEKY